MLWEFGSRTKIEWVLSNQIIVLPSVLCKSNADGTINVLSILAWYMIYTVVPVGRTICNYKK